MDHILIILVVAVLNFLNEGLHWLCGKRTLVVYICVVMRVDTLGLLFLSQLNFTL